MSRTTRPCRTCGAAVRQPRFRLRRRKWKYCRAHRSGWLADILEALFT